MSGELTDEVQYRWWMVKFCRLWFSSGSQYLKLALLEPVGAWLVLIVVQHTAAVCLLLRLDE